MSAWKACDVRGLYPNEVSPDLFRRVARHFGKRLPSRPTVLVAGDFRPSTPVLKEAIIAGLLSAGARVLDAGQLPSPVAYFAHQHWGTDGILIITASHNPAEYNGLKLMAGHLPPTEAELEEFRVTVANESVEPDGQHGRNVEVIDPTTLYLSWIEQRWRHLASGQHLNVVLDAGNGAWSALAPAVFGRLNFAVHPLFCEIDGSFPNRPPDSARAKNLGALAHLVRETGADLGIAWDGDGDRVAFVDECGEVVSADKMAILLARYVLRNRTGEKIVYDIKLSDLLRRNIEQLGGIPIMERSGHTFLKHRMIEEHCLFGCEVSGHYFFRELHGGDDGLFTALMIAELVAENGPLGQLHAELAPMYLTPDLRVPAGSLDYDSVVQNLRRVLRPQRECKLDGVRMEMHDGFVLVRRSVTEPVLTMRLEGFDATGLNRLVAACLAAFPEFAPKINEQLYQAEAV